MSARDGNEVKNGCQPGRDGYILCKALAYAIGAIENLPRNKRELSDRQDMVALLRAMSSPGSRAMFVQGVDAHTGSTPHVESEDENEDGSFGNSADDPAPLFNIDADVVRIGYPGGSVEVVNNRHKPFCYDGNGTVQRVEMTSETCARFAAFAMRFNGWWLAPEPIT